MSASSSVVSSPARLPWEASGPRPRVRQTLDPWLDGTSSGGASSEVPATSRRATQESAAAPERSEGGAAGGGGRQRPAQQRSWLADASTDGPPGLLSASTLSGLSHGTSYQAPQAQTSNTSQGGASSGGYAMYGSRSVASVSAPNQPQQQGVSQPMQPTPGWPPPLPWAVAAQPGSTAAAGSLGGGFGASPVGEFPLAPITIKRQIPSHSDSKAQVQPLCVHTLASTFTHHVMAAQGLLARKRCTSYMHPETPRAHLWAGCNMHGFGSCFIHVCVCVCV